MVNDWEAALLFRNGRYVGELAPGAHRFLALFEDVGVKRLPRRQWITATAIDVVSMDHFPLRLSVSAFCEIADAKLAFDGFYMERGQLALVAASAQAAAGFALDVLVTDRRAAAAAISADLADAVPGCRLGSAQIRAIMLPPEIRRLFTEIERARREGEAALERARAEHAALRTLANAARLLRGNPELMNLRLLQAVGGAKGATLVLGDGALAAVSPLTDLGSESK